MSRTRRTGVTLAVLAVVVAGAGLYRYASHGRVSVPVPVPDLIRVDPSPFGQLLYGSDRASLDFEAELIAGDWRPGAGDGMLVTIPPDATLSGTIGLAVSERGEGDGRRWVRVASDATDVRFEPPVVVRGRYGAATVSRFTAGGAGAAAEVHPMLAETITALVGGGVWGDRPADGGSARPAQLVSRVTVRSGSLALRERSVFDWGEASVWVAGPGSTARVSGLTARPDGTTRGTLDVRLTASPGTVLRAGSAVVRAESGTIEAPRRFAGMTPACRSPSPRGPNSPPPGSACGWLPTARPSLPPTG